MYGYIRERKPYGQYPNYYLCDHCGNTFDTDRSCGKMIQPEPCAACGHTAVKVFRLRGFRGEVTESKMCMVCKQAYDMDLRPIGYDLKPMALDEPADDAGEYITIEIAPEATPAAKGE